VPVEELKFKPFTNVPVNEYVNEARPPEPGTPSENALFAVPNKPVVGVAIDNSPETVRVAANEVVKEDTPELKVFVTTTVYEAASAEVIDVRVNVELTASLIETPSFFQTYERVPPSLRVAVTEKEAVCPEVRITEAG
jgi:hypothetical protein